MDGLSIHQGPEALGGQHQGPTVAISVAEVILSTPTNKLRLADAKSSARANLNTSLGDLTMGKGGHVPPVDVEVSDVKGERQASNEKGTLHPEDRLNALDGVVGRGGGPHGRDDWDFEPQNFAQASHSCLGLPRTPSEANARPPTTADAPRVPPTRDGRETAN